MTSIFYRFNRKKQSRVYKVGKKYHYIAAAIDFTDWRIGFAISPVTGISHTIQIHPIPFIKISFHYNHFSSKLLYESKLKGKPLGRAHPFFR